MEIACQCWITGDGESEVFYPFPPVQLKNIMVHDKGDDMGKGEGMIMCMVISPYFVVVVNSVAFERRIFQMQDMPAVPGVL